MALFSAQGAGLTLPALNPGADGPASLDRLGDQLVIPWYQEWAHHGRCYQIGNPTVATAVAMGGTSYAATTPALLVDVPVGTTIIPMHVHLRQGGTVAGGNINIEVSYDVVRRYSSGGTALTPANLKATNVGISGPRASACAAYYGATAAAVNTNIELTGEIMLADVATLTNPHFGFDWPKIPTQALPELVGPASFLVFTWAATTQPSWFFSVQWVELDS